MSLHLGVPAENFRTSFVQAHFLTVQENKSGLPAPVQGVWG